MLHKADLNLLLLLEYKDLPLYCRLYSLPARKYVKPVNHESIMLPTYWAMDALWKVCRDQARKSNRPKSNYKTHHLRVYARALLNSFLEYTSLRVGEICTSFQAAHMFHEMEKDPSL